MAAAFDETDEVALARAYCERKRIRKPEEQKEAVRVMNRLMRAGYASAAIFKLFKQWRVEVVEGGGLGSYGMPEF